MLRTNSKQAQDNLYKYIRDNSEDYLLCDYEIAPEEIETKAGLYKTIYMIFKSEKDSAYWRQFPESKIFEEWASGLAMGGLFCYYYNGDPIEDVKNILNETPEEASRYSRSDAERFLTNYIYNAIIREVRR